MSSTLPSNILAFLLTLGLVVVIHELGHFLFCKIFGVYVKTFSIGIGPKILRKQFGETEYVISLFPFGGYVKMAGEGLMEEIQDTGTWEERKYPLGTEEGNLEAAGQDDGIPPERRFYNRPAYQRLLIFIAGPFFNVVLSFVLYLGLILANGLYTTPVTKIGVVVEDSPGALAGLAVGDQILEVSGESVATWGDIESRLVPAENLKKGETPPVELLVESNGQTRTLTMSPAYDDESGAWVIGIRPWNTKVGLVQKGGPAAKMGIVEGDNIIAVNGQDVTSFNGIASIINTNAGEEIEIVWERGSERMSGFVIPELREVEPGVSLGRIFLEPYYESVRVGLFASIGRAWQQTYATVKITLNFLGSLFHSDLGIDSVGGPLRIGQAAGEMLRWSFSRLLHFIAFFSVNLFLLNLMPVPVLDGGHVLFLILEVIRGGKPVPERLQAIATQMGLIILMLFMTFVIVLDFWKVTGH